MKTQEYTYQDFEAEVLEQYHDQVEKAANLGINVAEIINTVYNKNAGWEIEYTIPKVKNWIERLLEQKSAKPFIGFTVGFADVKGKNIPISMALVTPEGNKEIRVGWSPAIKKLDDSGSTKLENLAMMEGLIAEKENEYGKQWWLIDVTSQAKLDPTEFLEQLAEMGIIREPVDVLAHSRKDSVVVMKFPIRRIYNPSKKVNGGEEKIPTPIWQQDDDKKAVPPKFAPTFTIDGVSEDGIAIRVYIGASHLQRKTLAIPQIDELCKSAVEESAEPEEQALYLEGMLRNRDVVVVGRIFAIDKEPTERNNGMIMMSAFGVFLIPSNLKIKSTKVKEQQTLDVEPATNEPAPEKPTPENSSQSDELSPVESAVRENIITLVNMRAQKALSEKERAAFLRDGITTKDMVENFKVGDIMLNGKKKKVKKEIVESIIEDMRKG